MPSLTINLSDIAYDGLAEAAQRNGLSLSSLAADILQQQGLNYSNLYRIGVITSAAFIRRFTTDEYIAISAAAEEDQTISDLVTELTSEFLVALHDPRVTTRLALLVERGLLSADRPAVIVAYDRPVS